MTILVTQTCGGFTTNFMTYLGTWSNIQVAQSGSKVNLASFVVLNGTLCKALILVFSETKGTDITEAFESAHLDIAKARAILNKYFVKDINTPRISMFTFEPDDFYATVRDR